MLIENNFEIGKYFSFEEAKNMPVHRWFYYKEGFSPRLFDFIEIKEPVLDPFMGSGTTLLACNERCIDSYGLDISELSYFITKTKTSKHEIEEIDEFEHFINELKNFKDELYVDSELFSFYDIMPLRNIRPFFRARKAIEYLEKAKALALLCLISILPIITYIRKDGGVLKIDKRKNVADFYKAYRMQAKKMIKDLKITAEKEKLGKICYKAKPYLGDARDMPFNNDMFSTIITSPPYINNVDYSKIYSIELAVLTLDKYASKKLRKALFPSFLSGKGSYGEHKEMIVNAYLKATKEFFNEAYRVLKKGGKIYYNVSNALIHNMSIEIDNDIANIMADLGFKNIKITIGKIRKTRINWHIHNVREVLISGMK
ncbi:MAG: DNA methyltransferase [Candidatus Anstonellales archaeon]